MLRESDAIIYPSRAQSSDVLAGLKKLGVSSANDPNVKEFLAELEACCFESSIDFSFCAAHTANETSYWRDDHFKTRRNPAGIGITGEPGVLGPTFPHYRASAEFYIAELLLKLRRPIGRFAEARQYAPTKYDGVQRLMKDTEWPFPDIKRISDLNKRFGPGNRECSWFCDPQGPAAIVAKGNALLPSLPSQEETLPMPTPPPSKLNMTKGLIPLPPHTTRLITPQMKPEGVGWNALGKRPDIPDGVTLHRMQGNLWGTDSYFRRADIGALTDWGIDNQTGEMLRWLPDGSTMTPWASGTLKAPYGPGKAFVDKYGPITGKGANVINWSRSAIEIGGFFAQPGSGISNDSPLSDLAKRRICQWVAHYAHDAGIPWPDFPNHPDDDFWYAVFHIMFTKGTGKICPGNLIMEWWEDDGIGLTRDIMRAAQGDVKAPPVPPFKLALPRGMTLQIAEEQFGVVKADGRTYGFNPKGPVSLLWLDLAITRAPKGQVPTFPTLEKVEMRGKRQYFYFEGGLILWKPNAKAAVEVLGGNPAQLEDDLDDAA